MISSRRTLTLLFAAIMVTWSGSFNLIPGNAADSGATAKAYFAGGCFWCMEEAFEKVGGVIEAVSGYMGGTVKNPSYEEVSSGRTGHAESVEVRYDPAKVTYSQLLEAFWRNVDPVTPNAQFCDH
ncbi:MAG TPA: peptide-methionine (S)-S-oxide reductase MsrA, partial [Nitrospira sp.]|nr:peptide-methionine (S)-S-oxide reductase MsrA [Nitrospira sp.]